MNEKVCARHYALLKEAQSADEEKALAATSALIAENMGLVRQAALRFQERGIEYEDLIQIGTVGMLRAIKRFDLSRGTAFSTFAVPLIVGEIRRNLRDTGPLHVGRSTKELAARVAQKRREIAEKEGRDAGVDELAAATDSSSVEVAVALSSTLSVLSLSDTGKEEGEAALGDRLTDEESEHEWEWLNDRLALGAAIGHLTPLWRKILLLRYFRNRTQQDTANALGLSQVKVSREEKKLLAFLRKELTG